ncbi:MAG TPA: hypothetical protein VG206_03765 [Terriglobia bacterium]|nr:hypothetical protein [Terriglobia bacterium]
MREGEPYFEMAVVAELIEQEFAALRQSLDLRKQVIDHCRDFPMPPQDVVDQLRGTGDEILRKLGEINRLVRGKEATFTRPPPGAIVPSRRSRFASQR